MNLGNLGFGFIFDVMYNSGKVGQISQDMNQLQTQAQGLGKAASASMSQTVGAIADAQGRLRDAQGRFLSVDSPEYVKAMKNGLVDVERALDDSITKMQGKLANAFAGAALMSPFVIAVNKARAFEAQLSSIKALGTPKDKMGDVEKLSLDMGAATKFSALEAAQGIEELLKAGVKMEDIMKGGLKSTLDMAVAGEISVAEAAQVSSVALNSFSKDVTANITSAANSIAGAASASSTDVHKMSLAFSEVSAVANNFQQSIDMTSTALAVLAQGGIQSGQAGTALKTMLQRLNPSTKEARQTMMELGLMTKEGKNQFTDAAGNYKSLAEISQLLQNSLKGLSQESQNIAMERLFGSESIKAALVFANKGAKGFADMKAEMTKFTVASIAADKLNNFNGALEMLMGTIDTILIQVGQLFLPALTMLTQVINVAANAFQSFIGTNVGKFFAIAAAGVTTLVVVFGAFIPLIRTTSTVFYVMTLAARQSLIAFLPYLPVVAAVTAVVVTVMTAMKAFRGVLEENEKPATGLWGVMQRLGAVLWSVGQIVDSWNGKSFDLGGNEAKLQALGMLDTIRAVGTYVVRFVEFFKGVGAGVYSVFASVAGAAIRIYNVVVQAVNGFMRAIGMQSAMLKFSSSDVQTWITVGKTLGYIIGTVLVVAVGALTISLGSMAIAVIAATWPILAVIAAVSAVVAVFYYWDDIVAWFSSGWQKTMKTVQDYAARLATYFDKQFSKDLSAAFIYLAHNAPVWIGKAVNFIVSGILQIVPILIKAWFDFGVWFMDALPKIAMQATEGAGTYFADFVWWAIGKFIDFQWWLLENVPYMLLSAFFAAFTFVLNLLGQFIWNIGEAFLSMGIKAGNALWDGLKSVWSKLVEWWNTAMQSLGIDSLVVNAEQNVKTNKTNELIGSGLLKGGALELSTQMAQGKAQQINFLSPVQPEAPQTAPQEQFLNVALNVDGETLANIMERVTASKEARK